MKVTETATIRHPVSLVFATAADPEIQLKWDPGTTQKVEKLTEGPLGKGSRYRGTFKGFGVVDYEFTEFEPERKFTHKGKMRPGVMLHMFNFESVPEGTRLTQEGELKPNLMGRIMAPFMKQMLRKRFQTVAAEISQYLATNKQAPAG